MLGCVILLLVVMSIQALQNFNDREKYSCCNRTAGGDMEVMSATG